ncbi:gliding motility protein MglA [Minicystis rosea]|nr:gliding motility protein MglA [Minicystis rosea]
MLAPKPKGRLPFPAAIVDYRAVQLDFSAREVTIKLVYYGPALSGKTTNLASLHSLAGADARGRLMTLETQDDRTLFFDLLPLTFRAKDGDVSLRIKLFTVPGQPIHAATRRLVLQGADGVALIADSRVTETQNNAEAFYDLRKNLKTNGLELAKMPLVIQFNKRDLDGIRSDDELAELALRGEEPVYLAVATRGKGVVETLIGLLHLTWQTLDRTHNLSQKLSIDGDSLLGNAARQLGVDTPIKDLLSRRVGGFRPGRVK